MPREAMALTKKFYYAAGRWGPVNGTIAGKRRNWYPGALGAYPLSATLLPPLDSTSSSSCTEPSKLYGRKCCMGQHPEILSFILSS